MANEFEAFQLLADQFKEYDDVTDAFIESVVYDNDGAVHVHVAVIKKTPLEFIVVDLKTPEDDEHIVRGIN